MGLAFKGWTYVTALITLIPKHLPLYLDSKSTTYLDMGYRVTLVDKNWLWRHLQSQKISTMFIFLKVRGIRVSKLESAEFAILFLYFLGKDSTGRLVYALIRCEIFLVKELRANLLISNNILSQESFIIDIGRKNALIWSCAVIISINTKQWGQFFSRKLLTSQKSVVSLYSKVMILLVKVLWPNNHDFLFYPTIKVNLTLYTHIFNYKTSKILSENTFNQPLQVF